MNLLARLVLVLAVLACTPSQAQLFRAYIASDGNDANPCTIQLPCRLLPAALNAVANTGEIWMLDSANFNTGTVNIAKSVTISAVPGSLGSIVVLGGHGLAITTAALRVTLRNVSIGPVATSPHTSNQRGIEMSADSVLTLDRCIVGNLTASEGVRIIMGRLKVVDSVFHNNGVAFNLQGLSRSAISGTRMVGNGTGVLVNSTAPFNTLTATVTDSVISGNGIGDGVVISNTGMDSFARLAVSRTLIEGNAVGVHAVNTGIGPLAVSVSGSTITGNGRAFHQDDGVPIYTQNNNHVADNTNADIGTVTYLAPK